ncbi:MAG TPA: ABC transporter permease [Candidatus Polarisedimenticolia bacterium]|nr:ABC transporter permease [Candidatus Polarisedimenticolia bacterium]
MPEGRPSSASTRAALALFGVVALVALLAPLIANDRPLLARSGGRLLAPALADLPVVGRLFDLPEARGVDWDQPPPGMRALWRAPVPWSYRGIRLDEALRPPGRHHLLGTDALGRDLLARLIHGTRPSLLVGLGAASLALLCGGILGALAGLGGRLADLLIVRLVEIAYCFSPYLLALALQAALGHAGVGPMIAGIALNRWTVVARLVRGEILRQRGGDLWASARASGASLPRLALRHLLPLLAGPLAVLAAFTVAQAIVLESGLAFLGFGVEPPLPSWGSILAESRATLEVAWWPVVFPTLALLLVLGSLCVAGEIGSGGRGRGQDTATF